MWINSWSKNNVNDYSDIDNAIYKNGIKNLETVLESKNNIKKLIIQEENKKEVLINSNLPISSMVKIANENLKKEVSGLNESEKKEFQCDLDGTFSAIRTRETNLGNFICDIMVSLFYDGFFFELPALLSN